MKHLATVLLLLAFAFSMMAVPVDISEKDRTVIYTYSINSLKDYQRLINEIGEFAVNDMEAAKSSAEGFLELFVNRQVLIYNDLDPAHNLSPFYEAETYISNLLLWYPDGMLVDLDFDNARVGEIMQHEADVYSLDILMTKRIDGNYLNRAINNNSEELLFRVAFNKKGAGYSNYKIVGIRSTDESIIPDFNKNLEEVKSEELSENEMIQVSDGMKAVMYDYSNYLGLLGDPEELEEDKEFYMESFTALFANEDVIVYNDIEPEPENYLISVEEYLSNLKTNYPSGIRNISLPVDSARIGKAIKTEEGYYYAYLNVDKFFSGNFEDKELFRNMFPLTVKIRFNKAGNAFTDFRIQSVDIEAEDYFQAGETADQLELPSMTINTVTRKGWSLGFEASYGQSPVENQIFNSIAAEFEDNQVWESTPGYGIKAGVNAYYFFTDNIGIKTGLSYNTYESNFKMDGIFTDGTLSEDVNLDRYNKILEIVDYDSAVNLSYIGLPLALSFTSGKPGKIGFFLEAGAIIGYKLTSQYHTTGKSVEFYGYYPDHPTVTQVLRVDDVPDLEALGFYKQESIDRIGDIQTSSFNISGYGSLGVNISLGYFSTLKIGPELHYGISDIDLGNEYRDIFGNVRTHRPTILKKYSIKFSYILKL